MNEREAVQVLLRSGKWGKKSTLGQVDDYGSMQEQLDATPKNRRIRRAGLRMQMWSQEKPASAATNLVRLVHVGAIAGAGYLAYHDIQLAQSTFLQVPTKLSDVGKATFAFDLSKIDVSKISWSDVFNNITSPQKLFEEALAPMFADHALKVESARKGLFDTLTVGTTYGADAGVFGGGTLVGLVLNPTRRISQNSTVVVPFLGKALASIG